MKIIFDEKSTDWVLSIFNKTTDKEGFIVEKSNKSQRVLTPEGLEIMSNELAIVKKGSEKFITGDLTSLMKYSKKEI